MNNSVLILDNHDDDYGCLVDILSGLGYEDVIHIRPDTQVPSRSHIKFVFADIAAFAVSATVLVKQLRTAYPGAAVILLSACEERQTMDACFASGCDDILIKGSLSAAGVYKTLKIAENRKKESFVELIRQKQQLNFIVSSINEVVWVADPNSFELQYVNAASEKLTGFTPDEITGDPGLFLSCIHPDDRKAYRLRMLRIHEEERNFGEYRIIDKQGHVHYVREEAFLKRDSDGRPEMLTGLSVDVTELRDKERELQEKIIETEGILDNIADGFFILDRDWRFTYINKAFERICNKAGSNFIGQNYWEKFPGSVGLKWYTEYHRAMREQVSVHFEEYASSLDRWVSVSAYPKPDCLTVYFTDITEERKLQETIAYNERNLLALINNTEDLIWSIDRRLHLISANESYKQSIYRNSGQCVSIGDYAIVDAFDEERRSQWKAFYSKALAGKTFKVIQTHTRGEGIRYLEVSFNPIRDSQEVIGVSCFCRDITEERKLQERLQANERNLRALIDNTTDFIWSVDRDLNIIAINKTFRDTLKWATGKDFSAGMSIVTDDVGADTRERWAIHYKRALAGECLMVVDERLHDGRLMTRETSLHPIIDDAGDIIGVSCCGRDVSQQKRMQEKILLNEHNMRGLINSTKDLIWSVDTNWHIIAANDAYTEWMVKIQGVVLQEGDYSLPDVFGQKIIEKFIGYYRQALSGASFRVAEKLKPNSYDVEYIETRYNPIYDSHKNVIGVSCSARDITENRRYQERIETKNQRLREIAAIQSHEVRGQVATILGLAQLFNFEEYHDPINGTVLDGFLEATQTLDRIIRRIVGKTRIMDEL